MKRSLGVFVRAQAAATSVALTFGILAIAGSAVASPSFPAAVAAALSMPCTPTCRLCHLTDAGGPGQIRPGGFGEYLKTKELIQAADGTVAVAIAGARAAVPNRDGDGDGMSDLDELAIGRDPNDPGLATSFCGDGAASGPEYGCGAGSRVAPGESVDGLAMLASALALAVGVSALRRRNRRP